MKVKRVTLTKGNGYASWAGRSGIRSCNGRLHALWSFPSRTRKIRLELSEEQQPESYWIALAAPDDPQAANFSPPVYIVRYSDDAVHYGNVYLGGMADWLGDGGWLRLIPLD